MKFTELFVAPTLNETIIETMEAEGATTTELMYALLRDYYFHGFTHFMAMINDVCEEEGKTPADTAIIPEALSAFILMSIREVSDELADVAETISEQMSERVKDHYISKGLIFETNGQVIFNYEMVMDFLGQLEAAA